MRVKKSLTAAISLAVLGFMSGCAGTQTAKVPGEPVNASVYYEEVEKNGLTYVFVSPKAKAEFDGSGMPGGSSVGCFGYIPGCETVVLESEQAINEYKKRHNIK